MIENSEVIISHKNWLIRVINSCETIEQLESSMNLIGSFIIKLKKNNESHSFVRDIENEVLMCYIDKESQFVSILNAKKEKLTKTD